MQRIFFWWGQWENVGRLKAIPKPNLEVSLISGVAPILLVLIFQ